MRTTRTKQESIILVFFKEFIRIRGVVNWSAISFLGFILGVSKVFPAHYIVPMVVHIISTFFILSFTFGVNNYFDADSDRRNPRRVSINAIASGKISKKTGTTFIVLFMVLPLTLCWLYSIFYSSIEIVLFCAFLLFWMGFYSAPPFRFKGRPPFDVIWHFFAFLLLVMWGSFVAGSIGLESWLIGISIGTFGLVAQIENHILDYQFDKETGTKTFAVWAGINCAEVTDTIFQILHTFFLIPIILLYSLSYPITIVIVIVGVSVGLFNILRPRKVSVLTRDSTASLFCFTFSVYISCLVYHLYFVSGVSTLGLLGFLGIP